MTKSDTFLLESQIKKDGLNDTLRISYYYNFKNRNLNDWQNPHKQSLKSLKLILSPKILKGDQTAVKNISKSIYRQRL